MRYEYSRVGIKKTYGGRGCAGGVGIALVDGWMGLRFA